MDAVAELERGRESFADQAWMDAYESLSAADRSSPLGAEDLAEHPPFAGKLLELVARDEDGGEPPYGSALDIGCGSAVWGVRLAERAGR